jgi:hypothetical protein
MPAISFDKLDDITNLHPGFASRSPFVFLICQMVARVMGVLDF